MTEIDDMRGTETRSPDGRVRRLRYAPSPRPDGADRPSLVVTAFSALVEMTARMGYVCAVEIMENTRDPVQVHALGPGLITTSQMSRLMESESPVVNDGSWLGVRFTGTSDDPLEWFVGGVVARRPGGGDVTPLDELILQTLVDKALSSVCGRRLRDEPAGGARHGAELSDSTATAAQAWAQR